MQSTNVSRACHKIYKKNDDVRGFGTEDNFFNRFFGEFTLCFLSDEEYDDDEEEGNE